MNTYRPYVYNDKTLLLHNYILLGRKKHLEKNYDIFDTEIDKYAIKKLELINEFGFCEFECFDDLTREYYNTYKYLDCDRDEKIFLYTEIFCENEKNIIFHIDSSKNTKVWVNEKCISIHNSIWSNYFYMNINLVDGKNTILIEKFQPIDVQVFNIQILNYPFEMTNDIKALSNVGDNIKYDSKIFLDDSKYLPYNDFYEFMVLDYKSNDKNKNAILNIHNESGVNVIQEKFSLNQKIQINLNRIKKIDTISEYFKLELKFNDGKKIHQKIIIKPFDYHNDIAHFNVSNKYKLDTNFMGLKEEIIELFEKKDIYGSYFKWKELNSIYKKKYRRCLL